MARTNHEFRPGIRRSSGSCVTAPCGKNRFAHGPIRHAPPARAEPDRDDPPEGLRLQRARTEG